MAANTNDDMIIAIGVDPSAASRGLKKLQADVAAATGSVQKQFDNVGRGIDRSMSTALQSRINAMVGIGTKGAKEWSGALADQGKELERLRSKYSPLFTTINNYKTAVADIRRAHALGAISSAEYQAAMSRERQAALASTAAIKGRNAALEATGSGRIGRIGNNGFQTANIAAQFQDIAVTSAMGMSPLQIALQQGTQLSSVFATMGNGRQVVAGLGAAFRQLISIQSLLTIGLIAGGAAAIQYFSSIEWGGQKSEETLKKEAELVAAVVQKWGDALPALKAFNDERQRLADDKDASEALAIGKSAQWDELRQQITDVNVEFTALKTDIQQSSDDVAGIVALQSAFSDLQAKIEKGSATASDAKRVQDALAGFIDETGIPTIADFAKQFDDLAKSIENASGKAKTFDVDEIIRTISRFPTRGSYAGVERSADGRIQGESNPLPFSGPTPESRPLIELDGLPGADKGAKKAETAAQRAANAYRDLIKSADDRIAQLQLETDLLGTYGAATEAARFRMDLLQQSEDRGRSLNAKQRAEIEQKVALYARFSEALAQAKLQQDLLNKARFSSLSKQDQQIVTTLRQYGLSEDLGSRQAAMIRQSLESDEIREGVSSFLGDFKSALMENGGDIGDAFGTALLNALMNSMNKQWESLFDLIGSGIASAMKPGAAAGVAGLPAAAGGGAVAAAASGGVSSAVDLASGLFGASESKNRGGINSFLKKGGVDIDAAQTAWCAAFVNSSLEQVGVKGSGSLTANSFQNWGSSVNLADVMRGDVLLQSRGLGAGQAGGHVGFATGSSRMGASGLQLEMLSGNSGDAVSTEWVNAIELQARRATEASAALSNVGSTAQQATTGLGQFGSALSGTGGGGGGWLSGLLGSGSQWSMAQAGLLKPGLFADGGGVRGPGGPRSDVIPAMLSNGEFVVNARQTQKHRAILEAINNGSFARLADGGIVAPRIVSAPRTPRLNARGGSQPVRNETALTVQIQGANGDEHVRMLVKQGVEAGLHASRENDRRGGFGQMQTSYIAQKG